MSKTLEDELIENWLKEFKETGTVLIINMFSERFEKELIYHQLWWEDDFENGKTRYTKSNIKPF